MGGREDRFAAQRTIPVVVGRGVLAVALRQLRRAPSSALPLTHSLLPRETLGSRVLDGESPGLFSLPPSDDPPARLLQRLLVLREAEADELLPRRAVEEGACRGPRRPAPPRGATRPRRRPARSRGSRGRRARSRPPRGGRRRSPPRGARRRSGRAFARSRPRGRCRSRAGASASPFAAPHWSGVGAETTSRSPARPTGPASCGGATAKPSRQPVTEKVFEKPLIVTVRSRMPGRRPGAGAGGHRRGSGRRSRR